MDDLWRSKAFILPILDNIYMFMKQNVQTFMVLAFNKKYYVPNNAVLTIAGDLDIVQTKKWVKDYFGEIPRGKEIKRNL